MMNYASRIRAYLLLHATAIIALAGCAGPQGYTDDELLASIGRSEPTEGQLGMLADAEELQQAGDYDQALTLFQELLSVNPTITTAYLGIGDIYLVKKDYARAEPAFARAARLEPRNFDAQYGHGLTLQMLERFVEALRAYKRALSINPDSFQANINVATTYLQIRDPARAVTYAERAVEADPSNGPAHANLGAIYEELGRNAEAIDAYIVALELMGNRPPLMMNLINVLAAENRYREAANTAETLSRIEPTADTYERLGWCLFKLREYDGSIEAYRTAVQIDPRHWQSHNGVGVNALNRWLLSDRRDVDAKIEARDSFRRSLRINREQPKLIDLMLKYDL
jgi:tetratricopeptide (TPR) repeat protein